MLRIIPETKSNYKMEINVNNKDIARLYQNQLVKYRIISFPHKEYGVSTGKIVKIGNDIIKNSKNNSAYKVTATIDKELFYDKKGNEYHIKTGMLSEVKIITGEKRIYKYVLEKLDFIW